MGTQEEPAQKHHLPQSLRAPSMLQTWLSLLFLFLKSTRTSSVWAPYCSFSPKPPRTKLINSFIPSTTSEKPWTSPFGSHAFPCQAWAHGIAAAHALAHQLSVPHVQPRASEPSHPVYHHPQQILCFWAPSHASLMAPQEMLESDYMSSHFWKEHYCLKMWAVQFCSCFIRGKINQTKTEIEICSPE